jgi:hypothetical protein
MEAVQLTYIGDAPKLCVAIVVKGDAALAGGAVRRPV